MAELTVDMTYGTALYEAASELDKTEQIASEAEQVLAIMRSPVIRNFRHRGRRGDRVDRGHVTKRIRDVADSSIAVNGHFLNSHWYNLPISIKDYHFRESRLWTSYTHRYTMTRNRQFSTFLL